MIRFLVKLIATGIVAVPLWMRFAKAGFAASLFTALALGVLAWLNVDRLILPLSTAGIAALADAVLIFAFLWFAADVMNWEIGIPELLAVTAVLTAVEWSFHRFWKVSA